MGRLLNVLAAEQKVEDVEAAGHGLGAEEDVPEFEVDDGVGALPCGALPQAVPQALDGALFRLEAPVAVVERVGGHHGALALALEVRGEGVALQVDFDGFLVRHFVLGRFCDLERKMSG